MEENRNYQDEIDLKDLLFTIFSKWRKCVFVALVFAVILGSIKTVKGFKSFNDEEAMNKNKIKYENELESYEKEKTLTQRQIKNIEKEMNNKEEYMENSILMNLDPFDVYKQSVTYYIDTDYKIMPGMVYQDPNLSRSIVRAYITIANNGELYRYIAGNISDKLDTKYLRELITISEDIDNSMLNIEVIGNSKKQVSEIMNLIRTEILEKKDEINNKIAEHSIELIDDSIINEIQEDGIKNGADLSIFEKQKANENEIQSLKDSLDAKTKSLNELKEPENTLINKNSVIKNTIKYIVLGFVLGGFISVFFISISFLMSDKIISERYIVRRYGLMILGSLKDIDRKSGIDGWILKIFGKNNKMDKKTSYDIIAANIEAKLSEEKSIYISSDNKDTDVIARELSKRLSGIDIVSCGSIIKDDKAIKSIKNADIVVLVKTIGEDSFTELDTELDHIKRFGKEVLGVIVE